MTVSRCRRRTRPGHRLGAIGGDLLHSAPGHAGACPAQHRPRRLIPAFAGVGGRACPPGCPGVAEGVVGCEAFQGFVAAACDGGLPRAFTACA